MANNRLKKGLVLGAFATLLAAVGFSQCSAHGDFDTEDLGQERKTDIPLVQGVQRSVQANALPGSAKTDNRTMQDTATETASVISTSASPALPDIPCGWKIQAVRVGVGSALTGGRLFSVSEDDGFDVEDATLPQTEWDTVNFSSYFGIAVENACPPGPSGEDNRWYSSLTFL